MEDLLWLMFEKTGKIEYYIKYREIINEKSNSRKKI